jgi:hypothetical protein
MSAWTVARSRNILANFAILLPAAMLIPFFALWQINLRIIRTKFCAIYKPNLMTLPHYDIYQRIFTEVLPSAARFRLNTALIWK